MQYIKVPVRLVGPLFRREIPMYDGISLCTTLDQCWNACNRGKLYVKSRFNATQMSRFLLLKRKEATIATELTALKALALEDSDVMRTDFGTPSCVASAAGKVLICTRRRTCSLLSPQSNRLYRNLARNIKDKGRRTELLTREVTYAPTEKLKAIMLDIKLLRECGTLYLGLDSEYLTKLWLSHSGLKTVGLATAAAAFVKGDLTIEDIYELLPGSAKQSQQSLELTCEGLLAARAMYHVEQFKEYYGWHVNFETLINELVIRENISLTLK